MNMSSVLTLLVSTGALCGCVDEDTFRALEARTTALEVSNSALLREVASLRSATASNKDNFAAYMKYGDEGYSRLRFDLGTLLVNIGKVEAYGNGSKVTFMVGNVTSANIDGLMTRLAWGRVADDGYPEFNPSRVRAVTLDDAFPAGAWTASEIVLEKVHPSEIGFIRLSDVLHRQVSLRRSSEISRANH